MNSLFAEGSYVDFTFGVLWCARIRSRDSSFCLVGSLVPCAFSIYKRLSNLRILESLNRVV